MKHQLQMSISHKSLILKKSKISSINIVKILKRIKELKVILHILINIKIVTKTKTFSLAN